MLDINQKDKNICSVAWANYANCVLVCVLWAQQRVDRMKSLIIIQKGWSVFAPSKDFLHFWSLSQMSSTPLLYSLVKVRKKSGVVVQKK